ncbi:MAG: protease HtpX [Planctomycetaceae bacterium]|nr:protease HtpX [Planctomycetaceae bacterium]
MKRVVLFLLTNLAVILVLGVVVNVLGLNTFLQGGNLNLSLLLGFAFVFGMGGSFISLLLSKWIAKSSTGAQVIEQPRNAAEQWLVETVRRQASQAGIVTPKVAIYQAPEPNAFATGPNRNNALVAVSSGLLQAMERDEVEAVLGHEVSHVANGDMVTLTLIQGVINTFVIFVSRIVGHIVDRALAGDSEDEYRGPGIGFWITSMVTELCLGILASVIVMWFSRQREFRADAGGASLAGRQKMIAALQRLQQLSEPSQLPKELAAFGVSGRRGLVKLLMSHPPLEDRIAALREQG